MSDYVTTASHSRDMEQIAIKIRALTERMEAMEGKPKPKPDAPGDK